MDSGKFISIIVANMGSIVSAIYAPIVIVFLAV